MYPALQLRSVTTPVRSADFAGAAVVVASERCLCGLGKDGTVADNALAGRYLVGSSMIYTDAVLIQVLFCRDGRF